MLSFPHSLNLSYDFLFINYIVKIKRNEYPPGIYLLKVNNGNTRISCEICSKLTIKTPERHYCLYC